MRIRDVTAVLPAAAGALRKLPGRAIPVCRRRTGRELLPSGFRQNLPSLPSCFCRRILHMLEKNRESWCLRFTACSSSSFSSTVILVVPRARTGSVLSLKTRGSVRLTPKHFLRLVLRHELARYRCWPSARSRRRNECRQRFLRFFLPPPEV